MHLPEPTWVDASLCGRGWPQIYIFSFSIQCIPLSQVSNQTSTKTGVALGNLGSWWGEWGRAPVSASAAAQGSPSHCRAVPLDPVPMPGSPRPQLASRVLPVSLDAATWPSLPLVTLPCGLGDCHSSSDCLETGELMDALNLASGSGGF